MARGPEHPEAGGRTSKPDYPRADPALLDRLRKLPTANIADAMHRLGTMDSGIKPMWPGASIAGTAYTVWTRPGDNLGIHEALQHVRPGEVIVVNGGGDESRAMIGELIAGRAKACGVAGFVIDGAVRDADGLAEYGMPVFARSKTPAGPYKDGPFANSVDVAVAGVVVSPGEIVIGDADGVVVVPLDTAEIIAAQAESKHAAEHATRLTIDSSLTEGTGHAHEKQA